MLDCSTLPAWAMNRQRSLAPHCRFVPWTNSVVLINTAYFSHQLTVLVCSTLPAWAIIRQCWLDLHCRFGQEPTPLKQTSLSVGTTNRQCYSTRHCRVEPRTDTIVCRSVSVFKNRQWCQPSSLSVCHCRFKIRQWKSFWTDSDVHIWGSVWWLSTVS